MDVITHIFLDKIYSVLAKGTRNESYIVINITYTQGDTTYDFVLYRFKHNYSICSYDHANIRNLDWLKTETMAWNTMRISHVFPALSSYITWYSCLHYIISLMFHMQSMQVVFVNCLSRWTIGKSLKFHIIGPLWVKSLEGNACLCLSRGINFSIGQKVVLDIWKLNAVLLRFRPDIFVNKATVMFPRDNKIEKDFRWATLINAGHVNKKITSHFIRMAIYLEWCILMPFQYAYFINMQQNLKVFILTNLFYDIYMDAICKGSHFIHCIYNCSIRGRMNRMHVLVRKESGN